MGEVRSLSEMRSFKEAEAKNLQALEQFEGTPLEEKFASSLASLREAHRRFVSGELLGITGQRFEMVYLDECFESPKIDGS